jgi:hypothetical protein
MKSEIEYMIGRYWSVFGRLDYDEQNARKAEVKSLSIEQINDRLLEIQKLGKEEYDGELYLLLSERKDKLNDSFEWIDENITKFVQLNQKLMYYMQKLTVEKKAIVKEAEERISKNSAFEDFEVHATISPTIYQWDEEHQEMCQPEDGIYCLLDDAFDSYHCLSDNTFDDFDFNWNTMVGAGNDILKDYYICYGMHELYDHTQWSLQDIIQINDIWCDIRVEYYYPNWESEVETVV